VGSAQMAILSAVVRDEADRVAVGLIADDEECAGNDHVGWKKCSGTGYPCCSGHCDHLPHAKAAGFSEEKTIEGQRRFVPPAAGRDRDGGACRGGGSGGAAKRGAPR